MPPASNRKPDDPRTVVVATRADKVRLLTALVIGQGERLSAFRLDRMISMLAPGAKFRSIEHKRLRLRRQVTPATGRAPDLVGEGAAGRTKPHEVRAALDAITVDDNATDWADSLLYSGEDTAAHLGVTAAILMQWIEDGSAIWFGPADSRVLPLRQFEGGRPIPRLAEIVRLFADAEEAWEWLVAPNRWTGGASPIEWLRGGRFADVAKAAEGALDYA